MTFRKKFDLTLRNMQRILLKKKPSDLMIYIMG